MLRSKAFLALTLAGLVALAGVACSKKKTATGGEVKTETTANLKRIHFDFDKYNIRSDAGPVMKDNAGWLKGNPNKRVIVEGHCDEVGTNEYNMALGERRAKSSKDYLVNLGVSAGNMETVSYGEERPLDPGHASTAHATNRRAEFVVKK